jgi:hypothetical protein
VWEDGRWKAWKYFSIKKKSEDRAAYQKKNQPDTTPCNSA